MSELIPKVELSLTSKDAIKQFGESLLKFPQIYARMEHSLHDGVYRRTVFIPKGAVAVGVEVAKPSMLMMHGHLRFTSGDAVEEYQGFKCLECKENRRSMVYALEDSIVTTIMRVNAKTLEEAEEEYTHEPEKLQTRRDDYVRTLVDGGSGCGGGRGVSLCGGPEPKSCT